jgi:hypothetical protein
MSHESLTNYPPAIEELPVDTLTHIAILQWLDYYNEQPTVFVEDLEDHERLVLLGLRECGVTDSEVALGINDHARNLAKKHLDSIRN